MGELRIEADYLVMGGGAAGMAFVDSVLSHSDATVVIADRHDRPGGHWNDAYPFVRLHQPSSSYGVASAGLGSGRIDGEGLNAGLYELASGQEVLNHFDDVMRHRFLPSGRVRFLPMSDVSDDDRVVTSLLSGERHRVDAGRFVDATHSRMRVPSTSPPTYDVGAGVDCVPPNDLARRAPGHDGFVVIGAGKTAMDVLLWLLGNGVDPDCITWIVPRDSWVLDRANVQPGDGFFAAFCRSIADQVEAVALADSVDDLFVRLEAMGELRRLDPAVTPEAYHCAILSEAELAQLRRVGQVVRLGRVTALESGAIHLEQGTVPIGTGVLHVDCSAAGIPSHPATPVFDGDRITIQWVRTCQPTFSAALIGFVEATFPDVDVKNEICRPIVPPTVPLDWVRMFRVELGNRACWGAHPELDEWMAGTRLDPFTGTARARLGVDVEAGVHLTRYLQNISPAMTKLDELLADA